METDDSELERRRLIQSLRRQLQASRERQQSWLWQARTLFAVAIMGAIMLGAAMIGWTFLLEPTLVLGMAVAVSCFAVAGYYIVRSIVVRPSTSEAGDSPVSDTDEHKLPQP